MTENGEEPDFGRRVVRKSNDAAGDYGGTNKTGDLMVDTGKTSSGSGHKSKL